MANIRYGFPGKKLKVIGVTGTDGKTTTVNMIYHLLKDAGKSVSMISTINASIGNKSYDTGFHVTSPGAFDIQKYLKMSVENKDEFVVLEVTSHALEQFRVWGVEFEIGVVTNITHEHLDYHQTFEKYRLAKVKLVQNAKYAVLNKDDHNFSWLCGKIMGKVISFGMQQDADINPLDFPLKLKIPGEYNVYNALASAAVGELLGIKHKILIQSLENFPGLPGRMEEIKNNQGKRIFVDFAHTPHALEESLKTLRSKTPGRVVAVFGCAGERDREKRPLMGEISAKLADITILTDEDPRFEDRQKIIEEMVQGALRVGAVEGKSLFREPDREKAIQMAISLSKKGDTVGIFGKGHEKSMNYRGREKSWSDQKVVLRILGNGR